MNSLPNISLEDLDLRALFSFSEIFTSIVVVVAVILARGFLIRYVRKDAEILAKPQRRWIIRIKNGCALLIIILLIFIWAPQLHTFAISIAAFAVALVIATKEMILCMTGAIMRATSQPFKVGDWVTVDGITGEVVDWDLFAFRLQEVDMAMKSYHMTGRTITIPNSKLFTANVENANFYKSYIFENIRATVQYSETDPAAAMAILKDICETYFAPHRDKAAAFNRKMRWQTGVDVGSAEPSYDITTTDLGHYSFMARLFLPTAIAPSVGADIKRDFLHRVSVLGKEDAKSPETAIQTI